MKKEIDVKKLKAFLKEYLPAMDETIPTMINAGGCGYFAYHLSMVLDKMNVEHKLVAMYENTDDDYESLKTYMADKKIPLHNVREDHIVVDIDNTLFDALGVTNCDYDNKLPLNDKKLKPLLTNDSWNEVFDTSTEPQIRAYLDRIPELFKTWKPKTYKHKYPSEQLKPNLNAHTRSNMSPW